MLLNVFQVESIARARAASVTAPKCTLCDESMGALVDGAHAMCTACATRGLPHPRWKCCPTCAGLGQLPRSAVGPMNPTGPMMRAWAPDCETCAGAGYLIEPADSSELALLHATHGGDLCRFDDRGCTGCGVSHGECRSCTGIGYHRAGCPDAETFDPSPMPRP